MLEDIIKNNYQEVLNKVEDAKARSGRKGEEVTVVCVTKTFPVEVVQAAERAGIRHLGENYVQEALKKIPHAREVTWHFIGRLQRNKAKFIPGNFHWVHSIDSVKLAEALEKKAREAQKEVHCLIQVNVASEETKGGVVPSEVEEIVEKMLTLKWVKLRGLMTIPPIPEKPEDSRKWFVRLRELRDSLVNRGYPSQALEHLSMGMSDDFEVAVEEGATIIRVGRKIFGPRRSK